MGQNTMTSLTCHDEVCLLLPWYVNETLSDEERDFVAEHLKVCVACRGELRIQRKLSENVRNSATIELCEHVQFENLVHKIQSTAKPDNSRGSGQLPRFRSAGVFAGAASLLLLAALPFSGVFQSADHNYRTLARQQSASLSRDNDLRVIFSRSVSRAEREHLLSRVNGSIVEEPDANGVYRVRIDQGEAVPAAISNTKMALAFLRRHPDQVIFAEPVIPADP